MLYDKNMYKILKKKQVFMVGGEKVGNFSKTGAFIERFVITLSILDMVPICQNLVY